MGVVRRAMTIYQMNQPFSKQRDLMSLIDGLIDGLLLVCHHHMKTTNDTCLT